MDDIIFMTIIQGTPNLPRKLSSDSLSKSTMADDIIEHLTSIDILENHVVMMLMNDHLSHTTYVGMIEEHRKSGFTYCSNFL